MSSGVGEASAAELLHELGDRPRPVRVVVVPGVVDLEEDPLRPLVVRDVGRARAAPRIVREPERAHLPLHRRDVLLRS